MSATDRFRAWLVTGPLARGAAFAIELAVALARLVSRGRAEGTE
jgi:hypothetical protein